MVPARRLYHKVDDMAQLDRITLIFDLYSEPGIKVDNEGGSERRVEIRADLGETHIIKS